MSSVTPSFLTEAFLTKNFFFAYERMLSLNDIFVVYISESLVLGCSFRFRLYSLSLLLISASFGLLRLRLPFTMFSAFSLLFR